MIQPAVTLLKMCLAEMAGFQCKNSHSLKSSFGDLVNESYNYRFCGLVKYHQNNSAMRVQSLTSCLCKAHFLKNGNFKCW